MTQLKKMEGDVTLKAKQLASLRIDATNIEAIKQLKGSSLKCCSDYIALLSNLCRLLFKYYVSEIH